METRHAAEGDDVASVCHPSLPQLQLPAPLRQALGVRPTRIQHTTSSRAISLKKRGFGF